MDPDLPLLRASVANITTCMFFNRGECGACALKRNILVDNNFVTLLLRLEKGKAQGARLINFRQITVPRGSPLRRARASFHREAALDGGEAGQTPTSMVPRFL
jgi:hypothetical protein